MGRLSHLLRELRDQHPADTYLQQHEAKIRKNLWLRRRHQSYERALVCLDEASWNALRRKAVRSFVPTDPLRGQQSLYDQLNEAFAFRHLLRRGYKDVGLVPEEAGHQKKGRSRKTPDLTYWQGVEQRCCEVKTINISDDEIARNGSSDVFDAVSLYSKLATGFERKLTSHISKAVDQLKSHGTSGMVYVLVHSDDWTLEFLPENAAQVRGLLRCRFPTVEVCVKFGVYGRHHLTHRPVGGSEP